MTEAARLAIRSGRLYGTSMTSQAWHGWRTTSAGESGAAGWVDLSHPLHANVDRVAFFPVPRFERVMDLARDRVNVTEMQMVCHFGTHIDAPCHFIAGAPAMHQIPLERLYGSGVIWRVPATPYGLIEREHLDQQQPAIRSDDILLIDTGWAVHFGTARYAQNPSLSVEAAEWIVNAGVKLVGLDCLTPDIAVDRRPPGFDWPIHHILLGNGVLIVENLTNLAGLAGHRVEVMCGALNIEGADGAPVRILARRLAE